MWQAHKDLLNSVKISKSMEFVERKLTLIADSSIVFIPVDILRHLKTLIPGKHVE